MRGASEVLVQSASDFILSGYNSTLQGYDVVVNKPFKDDLRDLEVACLYFMNKYNPSQSVHATWWSHLTFGCDFKSVFSMPVHKNGTIPIQFYDDLEFQMGAIK